MIDETKRKVYNTLIIPKKGKPSKKKNTLRCKINKDLHSNVQVRIYICVYIKLYASRNRNTVK